AAQHGRVVLRRHVHRVGAQPDRRQAPPSALRRPPRDGGDRDRPDVEASGAVEGAARRGAGLGLSCVMAGFVPAIRVFVSDSKTWMPGTRPGMTKTRNTV